MLNAIKSRHIRLCRPSFSSAIWSPWWQECLVLKLPNDWRRCGLVLLYRRGRLQPPPPPPHQFCRIINNLVSFYHCQLIGTSKHYLYSNESVRFPAFNLAVCVTNFVAAGFHLENRQSKTARGYCWRFFFFTRKGCETFVTCYSCKLRVTGVTQTVWNPALSEFRC